MSIDQLYSRDRVNEILGRVRLIGGVPPSPAYIEKLSTWFRGLAAKGLVSASFIANQDRVREKFIVSFPNLSTRSAYIQSFLKYLTGLHEDEYRTEYPNIERGELVKLLRSIPRNTSLKAPAASAEQE